MTPDIPKLDALAVVLSASLLCVAGAAGFLVMPVLVSAVVGEFSLDEAQAGFFASAVMAGSAFASLLAVFWVRRVSWHVAGLVSGLGLLTGHFLS